MLARRLRRLLHPRRRKAPPPRSASPLARCSGGWEAGPLPEQSPPERLAGPAEEEARAGLFVSSLAPPSLSLRFRRSVVQSCCSIDFISAYDCVIPPMEKAVVKTDIQIALPSGCYGRVAPRSGLAAKHFIDVGAGVIDEDYRGNVGVVLFNFGKETFEVKKGDRIAQLICERIYYPELEEVQALDDTERGEGGFGSTGKN
ncbi:deoxyuridine 5'-triphosphate nucleotidohydrolase, mitochondrial isoform X1 [Nyctibius grandis]|uniref:deoxyuridine 5'-triphosphate nucleotidohydrolase, mitochondrial isoform X1 n=2 Tax=Caprimulgiformes TaxID=8902 RepID=UPI0035BC6DE6